MACRAVTNTDPSKEQEAESDTSLTVKELQSLLDIRRGLFPHHVDEVWPNLYLGDLSTANNRYELWKMGITHVLNAAHGNRFSHGNPDFYGSSISYHGVAAFDLPDFDMSKYFYSASDFIHRALSTTGARLLVHCVVGVSRSATLVLAYVMIHHHLSLTHAIKRIQKNRWISPNPGFLRQLIKLDGELHHVRRYQGQTNAPEDKN